EPLAETTREVAGRMHVHAIRAARPEQELDEPLEVEEIQPRIRVSVGQRRGFEAIRGPVGVLERDADGRAAGGAARVVESAVKERRGRKRGIELGYDAGTAEDAARHDIHRQKEIQLYREKLQRRHS